LEVLLDTRWAWKQTVSAGESLPNLRNCAAAFRSLSALATQPRMVSSNSSGSLMKHDALQESGPLNGPRDAAPACELLRCRHHDIDGDAEVGQCRADCDPLFPDRPLDRHHHE